MKVLRVAFLTGLLFAGLLLAIHAHGEVALTPSRVIVLLLLAGVIGFGFAWLASFLARKTASEISIPLSGEEKILRQGVARDLKSAIGVTGKLMLTDRHLIFMPVKISDTNPQLSWKHSDIVSVREQRSTDTFRDGITVTLINEESHTFAVDDHRDWIFAIRREIANKQES